MSALVEGHDQQLAAEAVDGLLDRLARGRVTGESRELDFMPWGGGVRTTVARQVHAGDRRHG